MNVEALTAELAKGRIRPAYLVLGEEALLRDAALAALEGRLLADGPRDFNFDRLEPGSAAPARLGEALATLPLMARHRLVVVREGEGRGGGFDEAWSQAIEQAIAGMSGEAETVLVVVARKLDRRSRLAKAFREPAVEIECEAPSGTRELLGFLERESRRLGLSLDADAAELLAERIGPHLLMLRAELEKLALYAGERGRVDRGAVSLAVSDVAEESIWSLTDAIGLGRTAESVEQLARMFAQGQASQAILGALASHFRRLVRVGHGEAVKGPPFAIRKLEQQARRFGPARLVGSLRAIHRADVQLKGAGVLEPERALEQLVLQLAG